MIIPFFSFIHEAGKHPVSPEKNNPAIIPYEHEANIADGGEFLDDGIRMKEQPFCEHETKEEE